MDQPYVYGKYIPFEDLRVWTPPVPEDPEKKERTLFAERIKGLEAVVVKLQKQIDDQAATIKQMGIDIAFIFGQIHSS